MLESVDGLVFDNSYARLPERFYARQPPTAMPGPKLIHFNSGLARHLGLDPAALQSPLGMGMFTGNRIPHGAEPLAMAYGGHQFGGWAPRLGDGRALLLGEIVSPDGVRRDIQLKGSGRTPFSRSGDGRAPLGPVLREYVVSEAMHALGIPTTRALAAAFTGETVRRERLLPGAILTRIAQSHVRVGTFEYFAAQHDVDALRTLSDYVIDRHYSDIDRGEHQYLSLLRAVMQRQAQLVARWMEVGFIHGVMNTDNTQIAGETIDYGPCAFMDSYHPDQVFSSIDRMGRYAYSNQPRVAHWNLACLARALLPILADDADAAAEAGQGVLDEFPERYENAWAVRMRKKLGLELEREEDVVLARDLLICMAENRADFTLTFRALGNLRAADPTRNAERKVGGDARGYATVSALFDHPESLQPWLERYRQRLALETSRDAARHIAMQSVNPAIIPRNHLVEAAIDAALEGHLEPFETLVAKLQTPFDEPRESPELALPPQPHQVVQNTFCGT